MVGGEVVKHPYPHVKNFTSHEESVTDLRGLFKALKKHADLGHCLLKGTLLHSLNNESRAGSTSTDASSNWVCLDFDRAPFKTPAAAMQALGLADVAHIVQYSASQGLPKAHGLSCHIFMLLSHAYQAPYLKTWLMHLNLTIKELRQALSLTSSHAYLHWPLDVTACQNDKLIYIAPPTVGKGVRYSMDTPVEYVVGKIPALPIERLKAPALSNLKEQAAEIITAKRAELGLKRLRSQVKWVGEYEVQAKPGEAQITGMKEERGFVYMNLNGGDSWGYYHPQENFEVIHNFKGEPSYLTKELLPGYYKDCTAKQRRKNATPNEAGELVMGICERRTGRYWKVTWNPTTKDLRLDPARSELQLEHFLNSHGLSLNDDFVPQWDLYFDPQDDTIVDEEANRINLYVPSKYYREERRKGPWPIIKRLMLHAVANNDETSETWKHWINWLAVIVQKRVKTRSAYVLSGTYGTGKSLISNAILKPLLGNKYVALKRNRELEDKFIGWLENSIVVAVDEAQVAGKEHKETIHQELKNWITEPTVDIRRMNTDTYEVPSYVNFIFASNKRDPVQLDAKDRRFNFGDFQEDPLPLSPDEIRAIHLELPFFFDYLMSHKADVDYAAKIIRNKTRDDVVNANLTSVDLVARALLLGDLAYLWESMPDMKLVAELHGAGTAYAASFASILERETVALMKEGKSAGGITKYASRLTREELGVIFTYCVGTAPDSPNKFTRMLKHHEIETRRLRIGNKVQFGIEVEWRVADEWVGEHREQLAHELEPKKVRLVK